jgi:hypothetical protein
MYVCITNPTTPNHNFQQPKTTTNSKKLNLFHNLSSLCKLNIIRFETIPGMMTIFPLVIGKTKQNKGTLWIIVVGL